MIKGLTAAKATFGFETTLSGRGYVRLFEKMRMNGYWIVVFFLWLPSPDMAVARVRARVRQGGHNVPEFVIRRRYRPGLMNSSRLYRPLAHIWRIYDASYLPPKIVAHEEMGRIKVLDATMFKNIMQDIGA
jgi:predicted ABC-type ATPase